MAEACVCAVSRELNSCVPPCRGEAACGCHYESRSVARYATHGSIRRLHCGLSMKIFLSYRRTDPDQKLAKFLFETLESDGHSVFWDNRIPVGKNWAEAIDELIREADVFIVIISEDSMRSDMVAEEVKLAHELSKRTVQPLTILPVRLAYLGKLSYALGAYLNPIQYTVWNDESDSRRVVEELLAAIRGGEPLSTQPAPTAEAAAQLFEKMEKSGYPLPKAEPILEVLGLVPDSPFYVTRDVDSDFFQTLASDQGVATLHAPRQMGKSSLIARLHKPLRDEGLTPVFVDFKLLASEEILDARAAFQALANEVAQQLSLTADADSFFTGKGFATSQFQKFLTTAVADAGQQGMALLFDDIDSVFEKPYRNGLFGGLRAIIDQKPYSEPLRRIKFGFAHSHDPAHWIQDRAQSPFNVAKVYVVPEFNEAEMHWLNDRHGQCVKPAELRELFEFTGGHPFLTRVALYWIARGTATVACLKDEAASDQGTFGDHLRSRLWSVFQGGLNIALRQIIDTGRCDKELDFQSLLAMGLVKGANHRQASARFGLYQSYFQGRLDA